MSRVITFSRVFPKYHPKAGQPTYFVEKLTKCFHIDEIHKLFDVPVPDFDKAIYYLSTGKRHTIRAGRRWKKGDIFSPRVWSEKPYKSKQIQIAPDTVITSTHLFEIYSTDKHCHILIDGKEWLSSNGNDFDSLMWNDGLSPDDFRHWFQLSPEYKKHKSFQGQIICWSNAVSYGCS